MTTVLLSNVRIATLHMAVLLSMRLFPFAIHAVVADRRIMEKAIAVTSYMIFPILACRLGEWYSLLFIVGGLTYYLSIGFGVNSLSRWLAMRRLSRSAVFGLVFLGFVLLPGVVAPTMAIRTFLVVGCELALSAYSYCVETSRDAAVPAARDCLFFLFLNPTLVYSARGCVADACGRWPALVRVAAGIAIMFVNVAVLRPLAVEAHLAVAGIAFPGAALLTVGYAMLRFSTIYAAHSGLASIQIGMMRHVGWVVPERYRYPFLATSPFDFWRRWNTYLRTWLEAYVFLPLARHIARYRTRHPAGRIVAAVVTLLASGMLHDAFVLAGRHSLASVEAQSEFFLVAGVVLAVWHSTIWIGRRIQENVIGRPSGTKTRRASLYFGRVAFACVMLAVSLRWG